MPRPAPCPHARDESSRLTCMRVAPAQRVHHLIPGLLQLISKEIDEPQLHLQSVGGPSA